MPASWSADAQERASKGRCMYCGRKAVRVEACQHCDWQAALCAYHDRTVDGTSATKRALSGHQNRHSRKAQDRYLEQARRRLMRTLTEVRKRLREL
jgi:hypothetical protein